MRLVAGKKDTDQFHVEHCNGSIPCGLQSYARCIQICSSHTVTHRKRTKNTLPYDLKCYALFADASCDNATHHPQTVSQSLKQKGKNSHLGTSSPATT